MSQPIVKIENVNLFIPGEYPRTLILKNIYWMIEQNKKYVIRGANGSGKSTLLRLISGDLLPCSGNISWLGANGYEQSRIYAKDLSEIVSPAIQENCQRQAWNVTVLDMLIGAKNNLPLSFSCHEKHIDHEIKTLTHEIGFNNWLDLPLVALSQGQLRITLLARALLRKPKILLLDEYTDGLDKNHKELFFKTIERYSKNMTVIFTSHREEGLSTIQHECLYMQDGRLYTDKKSTNIDIIPPSKSMQVEVAQYNIPKTINKKEYKTIFKLDNITVYIDRQPVLKNIYWQMQNNENWHIRGINGSGKSTFLRLLAGDEIAAAGGSITRWNFKTNKIAKTLADVRKNICLVSDLSQALYAYPLTALELLCSGFDNSIGLYREITEAEQNEAMKYLKKFFVDYEKIALSSIRRLSTGQLRKLFLLRALIPKPHVLLLDEPINGLDAKSRAEYLEMLNVLTNVSTGINLVFVSHYDNDIPSTITNEAVMENGRLLLV